MVRRTIMDVIFFAAIGSTMTASDAQIPLIKGLLNLLGLDLGLAPYTGYEQDESKGQWR